MTNHILRLTAAILCAVFWTVHAQAAYPIGEDGWTILEPSPEANVIYVSSSEGNDDNTGESPESPIKTLVKAYSMLRDGVGDWIRLKTGDQWDERLNWKKSGASWESPTVLTSYGTAVERPRILGGIESERVNYPDRESIPTDFWVLLGLHFKPTDEENGFGIKMHAGGTGFLIEDCLIESFKDNIVMQEYNGPCIEATLRRSVITGAHSRGSGHSQGFLANAVSGLLIEECIFYQNGWRPEVASPTIFNHNMYLTTNCTDAIVRNCIIMEASSHGIHFRPGGLAEDNLFVRNPINLQMGYYTFTESGVNVDIKRNVFLEGRNISSSTPRGWGINIETTESGVIANNILAHVEDGNHINTIAIQLSSGSYGVRALSILENIVYDWHRPVQLSGTIGDKLSSVLFRENILQCPSADKPLLYARSGPVEDLGFEGNTYWSTLPSDQWFSLESDLTTAPPEFVQLTGEEGARFEPVVFKDPQRDMSGYSAFLGKEESYEAFVTDALTQSRTNWRPEYTAKAVNEYIRQGFEVEPAEPALTGGVVQSPQFAREVPVTISYSGAGDPDGGNVNVHLWVRNGADGQWTDTGLKAEGPSGQFDYAGFPNDGPYYFAVQAETPDARFSSEPIGPGGDVTIFDSTPPDPGAVVTPEFTNDQSIAVSYKGAYDWGSGVASVILWMRKGMDGQWEETDISSTNAEGNFEVTDLQEETLYHFAVVAQDRAGNISALP